MFSFSFFLEIGHFNIAQAGLELSSGDPPASAGATDVCMWLYLAQFYFLRKAYKIRQKPKCMNKLFPF